MSQGFSLKDQLFNADKIAYLAGLFDEASGAFGHRAFEARVIARLPDLELKERIDWIAACLAEAVPGDLRTVAPVIIRALPEPLDPTLSDDDFGDFIFAPLGEWVVRVGADDPDLSLDVLAELTQRFSMEWAIRPFLNADPGRVLDRMERWCDHDSYHVRRLVSEGTRPRLPWGQAVSLDLTDPLPLLDRLHADPTRYVTRSVANHLNDIAKKDADLVLGRVSDWRARGQQNAEELRWMTGHALRGLVKQGHPGAMTELGYDPDAELSAVLNLPDTARIGEVLAFTVDLTAPRPTPVLVDYIIHFKRSGGKVSPKVHKLKQTRIETGALSLSKKHKLKGNATTFKLVPGSHLIEVQINGRTRASATFDLLPER
ncbi:hypothetical protein M3P21_20620 [Ruegeria sp. 2012CJ41-6]|uniref:DNA alkylation repair protein n=1 Tax=Ruegeria spongiae TaxID=2942209 RepID=A0ABT0Q7S5_9RHOB|nr:hypothetical protein [Ruegeria spongiae]MCL6285925.1 hypothetical protein [Ruegeria spongiae]